MTPEQIESASFSTVKRGGYRTEAVDRFLRAIADEYRALDLRVRQAEGATLDLEAAGAEMAAMLRDLHAQVGERRRVAEADAEQVRRNAEGEAATIVAAATEKASAILARADRVLDEAEHHAELLRSDGEQRVREQAAGVLRTARAELQALVRHKHELAATLSSMRRDLVSMETALEAAAVSPAALGDELVEQSLIDLRDAQRVSAPSAPSAPEHPSTAATASIFNPPDHSPN